MLTSSTVLLIQKSILEPREQLSVMQPAGGLDIELKPHQRTHGYVKYTISKKKKINAVDNSGAVCEVNRSPT